MHTARTDFSLAAMGGKLYAVSGDTSGRGVKGATGEVESYDPLTNQWTVLDGPAGTLFSPRVFCTAVVVTMARGSPCTDPSQLPPAQGGKSGFAHAE
jgi:hypothetical protein